MALGAGRGRLVAQLLSESLLLGAIGGALGLLLSFWGVSLVASGIPAELHAYVVGFSLLRVDGRALAFTLLASLATGVIFGLAPALAASRPGVQGALREGSRGATGGPRTSRLRNGLVVAEMTLSVLLLAGASLMVRSFSSLVAADPGFRPDRVLTMRVTLPPLGYERPEAAAAWFDRLLEKTGNLSGVEAAGAVSILPMSWNEHRESVETEGGNPARPGEGPRIGLRIASPDYFRALSVPIRTGRAFTSRDDKDAPRVAIVSDSAARRLWPGQGAVGRRLRLAPGEGWLEVVGVAGDVRHNVLLTAEPKQVLYLPLLQKPQSAMSLVVRTAGEPLSAVSGVQAAISSLEPRAAAGDILTQRRVMESALSPQRVTAVMLLIFAAIGVALAASGIYGVLAYTVAQRRHEFGVRMALGAHRADILRLVLSQAVRLCGAGVALGLAGAFALLRVLRSVLFETTGADPLTFAALPVALLVVALLSSLVPARRAAHADPIAALRSE
jgi:putative ABC transport system permease protein